MRSDRLNRNRGGCCIYIQEQLNILSSDKYDNDYCEAVTAVLDSKVLVVCIYRPPKTPAENFEEVLTFMQTAIDQVDPSFTVIITGDFNFPGICWKNHTIDTNGLTSDCKASSNFMERNFLTQLV